MKFEKHPRKSTIHLNINGTQHRLHVSPWTTLLDALRNNLGMSGTKKGCDHGQCGACTVLVDGKHINSCLSLAVLNTDKEITTIEGLGNNDVLDEIQKQFIDKDGFQCGYCTPGQICSAVGLRNMKVASTDEEIRDLMSGNICRCGAYANIFKVVKDLCKSEEANNTHIHQTQN